MPKRTLTQKIKTAMQCHAYASVYYSGVGEDEMRQEDKGEFYSKPNKPHLVIKGENVGTPLKHSPRSCQYANHLTVCK